MVEQKSLREISISNLERKREKGIIPLVVYRKMKGYILEANREEQGW